MWGAGQATNNVDQRYSSNRVPGKPGERLPLTYEIPSCLALADTSHGDQSGGAKRASIDRPVFVMAATAAIHGKPQREQCYWRARWCGNGQPSPRHRHCSPLSWMATCPARGLPSGRVAMTRRGGWSRTIQPLTFTTSATFRQTYPRSPNLPHTHPRPMRMRGRQPVATAGGVWVGRLKGQTRVRSRCPYFRARRPALRKESRRAQTRGGSPQRRRGTRRVGVIHRVLRVGQKPCREVARCCFFYNCASPARLPVTSHPSLWGREKRNRTITAA